MQLIHQILLSATSLLAGLTIGFAFGKVQEAALRRNLRRQQKGHLQSGFGVMPGSMTRVAMLLLALVLAQVVCPLLFAHNSQWWVSGGVVAGYGSILLLQLRQRMAASR
jgi:hypothetical protein